VRVAASERELWLPCRTGLREVTPLSYLLNQNRTYDEEVAAGLIYAPHVDKGGAALRTYNNVARVQPGDLLLSVRKGTVLAMGVVESDP
jgi:hypothetical protein